MQTHKPADSVRLSTLGAKMPGPDTSNMLMAQQENNNLSLAFYHGASLNNHDMMDGPTLSLLQTPEVPQQLNQVHVADFQDDHDDSAMVNPFNQWGDILRPVPSPHSVNLNFAKGHSFSSIKALNYQWNRSKGVCVSCIRYKLSQTKSKGKGCKQTHKQTNI